MGDPEKAVVAWLGYPIEDMTTKDYNLLKKYVADSEEAARKKEKAPYLAPKKKSTPKR